MYGAAVLQGVLDAMTRKVLFVCLFSMSAAVSPAAAQSLSQLDFDSRIAAEKAEETKSAPVKLIQPAPEAPKPAVEEPAPAITSVAELKEQSAAQTKNLLAAAAKRAAPRARLKPVEWPDGVVGSKFLTPSLRGVQTDEKHDSRILSKYAWKKKGRAGCGEPKNEAEMITKSLAVREVLFRFSGSDEFASSQCQASCSNKGYSHQLTGLSFNKIEGGSFQFLERNGECRYLLTKSPRKKWEVLQPTRVSCACLPTP